MVYKCGFIDNSKFMQLNIMFLNKIKIGSNKKIEKVMYCKYLNMFLDFLGALNSNRNNTESNIINK